MQIQSQNFANAWVQDSLPFTIDAYWISKSITKTSRPLVATRECSLNKELQKDKKKEVTRIYLCRHLWPLEPNAKQPQVMSDSTAWEHEVRKIKLWPECTRYSERHSAGNAFPHRNTRWNLRSHLPIHVNSMSCADIHPPNRNCEAAPWTLQVESAHSPARIAVPKFPHCDIPVVPGPMNPWPLSSTLGKVAFRTPQKSQGSGEAVRERKSLNIQGIWWYTYSTLLPQTSRLSKSATSAWDLSNGNSKSFEGPKWLLAQQGDDACFWRSVAVLCMQSIEGSTAAVGILFSGWRWMIVRIRCVHACKIRLSICCFCQANARIPIYIAPKMLAVHTRKC